jgi:RHS repeat-associated protein
VTTYAYDEYDNVLAKTETAGSTVRTTTTGYDNAERATSTSTTVTPSAAGGTAVPSITYGYDTTTGLPTTKTGSDGQTLTTGYDTLGRATSYTDATGNQAVTGYDLDGRKTSVNDGQGTTTYVYDSATEHRSLITSENTGTASQPGTFTATYNAAGDLATETYPNGLTATTHYDNDTNSSSLVYAKDGSTWMTFTATRDAANRIRTQTSPTSTQSYTYDQTGRLTTVQDTYNSSCTTRVYGFDADSNRTVLNTYPAGSGGACSTNTTPTTTNSTYDQADRLTNTGYAYDTLGRTTTIPAADAQGIGSHATTTGNLTVGYYANDMVASQTQGAATLTYTLDPNQNRIATFTDGTTTTTNHYTSDDDSPDWTSVGTSWTRNLTGPDGNLAATETNTGTVTLQLTNLHGDVIATANDTTTATGTSAYFESTEYGIPRNAGATPDTYSWLGGKQRSTDTLGGLTLMGVRLYDPTTGRFESVDPIPGGNPNAYTYPTDPINGYDLNGQCGLWGRKSCFKTVARMITRAVVVTESQGRRAVHFLNHQFRIEWDKFRGRHLNYPWGSGHLYFRPLYQGFLRVFSNWDPIPPLPLPRWAIPQRNRNRYSM